MEALGPRLPDLIAVAPASAASERRAEKTAMKRCTIEQMQIDLKSLRGHSSVMTQRHSQISHRVQARRVSLRNPIRAICGADCGSAMIHLEQQQLCRFDARRIGCVTLEDGAMECLLNT